MVNAAPGAMRSASMPSVAPPTLLEHQILLVDDHDDIRDAMALVLELEGWAVARTFVEPIGICSTL